jgi:hypothetical protein
VRDASGAFSFPIPIISLKKLTFFHQKQNFFPKIFGSSKYSPYLCHRLQDDSRLSGKATVIAYGFLPQAFFMPKNIYLPNWRIIFS